MKHDGGVSIFVLVDALGWEILRDRPFLDDVLVTRRPLRTILGYSSGAIPTLLTGRHPDEHGHWNLFYRSPATSPFRWAAPLRRIPRAIRESRVVRRATNVISRRLSGYTGYFTMYNLPLDRAGFFDICETADIYAPGGLAPSRSVFDAFVGDGIAYECYNYHRHSDAQILDLVRSRLGVSDRRVYFLYLSELDHYLHFHIGDGAGITARLRWYEEQLRRVWEAALARWGGARFHLFSDHGMTPIGATHDLIGGVARLGLAMPQDYLPCYDSTMARFWLSSGRAEARLRDFLGSAPFGRLLTDTELKDLRIAFDDDRYGHLVFLMNSGVLICPSDMGRVRFAGMHGFHPDESESTAALLSTEPIDAGVEHIADIHGVIVADARRRA